MKWERLVRQMMSSLYVIVGVVFIWRGAWVILDVVDHIYFGGNSIGFAIALIAFGVAFLYLHDHRYDKMDHF